MDAKDLNSEPHGCVPSVLLSATSQPSFLFDKKSGSVAQTGLSLQIILLQLGTKKGSVGLKSLNDVPRGTQDNFSGADRTVASSYPGL